MADDLARVASAQARFEAAVADLSDAQARAASLLPGWTVGHVLTHVARNADSHVRRCQGAVDQYEGGAEGRAAEIEAGASRPAADLVEDVRASGAAALAAFAAVPDDGWDAVSRDVGGVERPLRDLPSRRWQELEVHVVDLGLGVTHRDWPDEFVSAWLPRIRASMASRVGTPLETPAGLDPHGELAWLYGRLTGPDWPVLPTWS